MWLMRTKDLTGNPQVLGVVVDVMKKTGVTEIQVSSLWRNSEGSPHKEGLGIDITAATRDGVTVRFNNSAVGSQSEEVMRIRDDIYNAFVSDERVSQALDPWRLESRGETSYSLENKWQNVYNTYLLPRGISLSEYNDATSQQQLRWVENDSQRKNMLLHRNHLHVSIVKAK
jgi:hypothetical protein